MKRVRKWTLKTETKKTALDALNALPSNASNAADKEQFYNEFIEAMKPDDICKQLFVCTSIPLQAVDIISSDEKFNFHLKILVESVKASLPKYDKPDAGVYIEEKCKDFLNIMRYAPTFQSHEVLLKKDDCFLTESNAAVFVALGAVRQKEHITVGMISIRLERPRLLPKSAEQRDLDMWAGIETQKRYAYLNSHWKSFLIAILDYETIFQIIGSGAVVGVACSQFGIKAMNAGCLRAIGKLGSMSEGFAGTALKIVCGVVEVIDVATETENAS